MLDLARVQPGAVELRQTEEEVPARHLQVVARLDGHHVEGLALRVLAVADGTDLDAQAAAGAIVRGHLVGHAMAGGEVLALDGGGLETRRGGGEPLLGVDLGADGGMGADQGTLATLGTEVLVPLGQFQGDAAFLEAGGGRRPGAVGGHEAHRQTVPLVGHEHGGDLAHKGRGLGGHHRGPVEGTGDLVGDGHPMQPRQGGVDGGEVTLQQPLTLAAIGLLHRLLDAGDGLVPLQDAGDGEKGGLHDGVDAPPHAGATGDAVGVDDVQAQPLVDDLALHAPWQFVPDPLRRGGGVEQEGGAGSGLVQHVVTAEKDRLMAGDEAGLAIAHQIAATDGLGPKAQVGDGDGPGLLGVVLEIPLAEVGGLLGDDLDGVLVGGDGAVGAQPVEDAGRDPGRRVGTKVGVPVQAGMTHVVDDAQGEGPLGPVPGQLVEDRLDHGRGEFLGREAIPAATDPGHGEALAIRHRLGQGGEHVLVQGLAVGARLLGAVEDRQPGGGGGDGGDQPRGVEGPVEAHLDQAHLLAPGGEMFDRLLGGAKAGAHQQDDPLRVRGANVFKEAVAAAGEGGEALHDRLDHPGQGLIPGVDALPALKIDIRVLGGTADDRTVRVEGAFPVGPHQVIVDQGADGGVGQALDLVDLVGGAEAVEEVDEGHPALQGRRLGDEGEVHHLLHRGRTEQSEAGGATGHDVGMIAEDRQGLSRQGARRHVHNHGGELAGDIVHVGDHQQQPLGGGEGRRQCPPLKGAVDGPGGAGLALHLDHLRDRAPEVGYLEGRPFVRPLAHVGGGGDGIDGDDFVGQMGDGGGGLVAVEGDQGRFRHGDVPASGMTTTRPARSLPDPGPIHGGNYKPKGARNVWRLG